MVFSMSRACVKSDVRFSHASDACHTAAVRLQSGTPCRVISRVSRTLGDRPKCPQASARAAYVSNRVDFGARGIGIIYRAHDRNLEQVYAASKQLELDAVVVANVNCSPHGDSAEAIQPFDVWVIDRRAKQAFHAGDKKLNFINVVRSVIAPNLSSY